MITLQPQPQPLEQLQPLPFNPQKCCSVDSLLVAPLRFCGRQWMRIRNDNNNQISQVALKIFIACATLLSGLPAVIGVLFFPSDNINIPWVTEYRPMINGNLIRRDTSNKEIEERIKENLGDVGHEYTIEVRSKDREIINDYYPEYIHRYVTLINPSSTTGTRFWETLKNHFYNKEVPSLSSLYTCINGNKISKDLAQLKNVLALHRAITFSIAFDLAYVHTELGERFHAQSNVVREESLS